MAAAIEGTVARLGAGVIVNGGAVVNQHCDVEEFVHLGSTPLLEAGGAWALGRDAGRGSGGRWGQSRRRRSASSWCSPSMIKHLTLFRNRTAAHLMLPVLGPATYKSGPACAAKTLCLHCP